MPSIQLIQPEKNGKRTSAYRMMDKIRKRNHHEIRKAKVALVWTMGLKPDKDGHMLLGRCRKASSMQKLFAEYDFVILLNRESWENPKFGKNRCKALLDHELCHIAPVYNKKGKFKKDRHGHYVFRTRKHDIEEFRDIVERHGCYKRDLELFAESLLKRRKK